MRPSHERHERDGGTRKRDIRARELDRTEIDGWMLGLENRGPGTRKRGCHCYGEFGDSAEWSEKTTIPTSIEQLFEGGGAASHARPARVKGRKRGSQPCERLRG